LLRVCILPYTLQVLRLTSDLRLEVVAGAGVRCGGPDGRSLHAARHLQLGPLVGLDFAPDGSLLLAEKLTAKQFRLLRIHSSGAVDTIQTSSAANATGVDISGLAVSPGGDVFLADNGQLRILRMDMSHRATNSSTEVVDPAAGQAWDYILIQNEFCPSLTLCLLSSYTDVYDSLALSPLFSPTFRTHIYFKFYFHISSFFVLLYFLPVSLPCQYICFLPTFFLRSFSNI
jgi:hypothetical protein